MMLENKAQEEAIHTVNKQVLVIACPGSGKTTTLLRRIHYMVTEAGISAAQILMITFTKAAADEMNKRYVSMYGDNPGVTFATIHSLCFSIVKKYGKKNVSVLSDIEIYNYFNYRVKYLDQINDKDNFVADVILDISVMKNNMISLSDYEPACTDNKELFASLYTGYEKYKEKESKVDFDDMLVMAKDILDNEPEVLLYLKNRYSYIQVDEYQDTNYIQRYIIYKLAGKEGNLAVVGDDDQSIYMFRGARPEIMLNFSKDYPECKVIHMSTNYRSLKEIIKTADHVVKHNSQRFAKDFYGAREEKGKVFFRNYLNNTSQLGGVLHKVRELLEQGVKPEQIAILYRTNKESMPFAEYFMREKIPFQCNERLKSKYHHWIFQDIQAYWKLSRGKKDKISFQRILNHPNRYFYGKAFHSVDPNLSSLKQAVWEQKGGVHWQLQKGLENAETLFQHFKILNTFSKPEVFMNYLYKATGYNDYLKEYAKLRKLDVKELTVVWNNLLDEAKLYGSWDAWGRYIVAYNRQLQQANKSKDGITLSTMHRAKGLEWDYVFIINCVDGTIPHSNAMTPEEIEEERRLFYVAMTRAKDFLYLSAYKEDGKDISSPFIEECELE
jgi:DNA helicase-2/ATP-dependent DNA helicase PcrA